MIVTTIGPVAAGELPEPWVHQFLDADGVAINLTGWTVKVVYKVSDGTQVVRTGEIVDGPTGKAGYGWVAADMATAGLMAGEMWVGNGVNRYARSFRCGIYPPGGGTAPNI